ncbi:hypothetical protein ALC60_00965 [Trachymyrmex zeteki]|uniref:Uncharacterized protein n=1 Tax=Mycetomoellerius zeteki TaxID=64791 RepID=A0A151XHV9_9HYME|nr:hypothetical protein ALC60_00965 [Trachymyrmex zeteki]
MEKNEDDNKESYNNSEKEEDDLPFGSKEKTMTVLNDLFKHGQNLSFNSILGTSMDERQSKLDSALELTQTFLKNKPSIIGWLRSNLFEESECNIPMALLFIALYEQHLLPYQKKTECDFRFYISFTSPFLNLNFVYLKKNYSCLNFEVHSATNFCPNPTFLWVATVLGNCSATFSPAASCLPLLAVLGLPPSAATNIRSASIFVGYPNLDCTCDPLHDKRDVL